MNCPHLISGKDYKASKPWPVVTMRNICSHVGRDLGAFYEFYSGNKLLAHAEYSRLTLCSDYASDGYSPGFWIGNRYFQLPPMPKAGMWPALGHDLTRQFLDVPGCPWTREDTDTWLFNWLVAGGTHPTIAGGFYRAVAGPLGSAFIALTRESDPKLRIVRIPYDS